MDVELIERLINIKELTKIMGDEATATGQKAQLAQMDRMIDMLSQSQIEGIVPMFGGQR